MSNIQLVWKAFTSHTGNSLKSLLEENDFSDVTLVCDDTKQMKAHKFVLSSGSSFFKTMLQNHPHAHPLIYLKGVKAAQLELILKFLYFGQVDVPQVDIGRFLDIAKDLKIKGLTEKPSKPSNEKMLEDSKDEFVNCETLKERPYEISKPNIASDEAPNLIIEECDNQSEGAFYTEIEILDDVMGEKVGNKMRESTKENVLSRPTSFTNSKVNGSNGSKINIKELISNGSNESKQLFESFEKVLKDLKPNMFDKFACPKCDYEIKSKGSLRRHYLSKHVGIIFKCGKCPKELTSQSGLKSHMEYVHEQYTGSWSYTNNVTKE
jgi:hypothetical protein